MRRIPVIKIPRKSVYEQCILGVAYAAIYSDVNKDLSLIAKPSVGPRTKAKENITCIHMTDRSHIDMFACKKRRYVEISLRDFAYYDTMLPQRGLYVCRQSHSCTLL